MSDLKLHPARPILLGVIVIVAGPAVLAAMWLRGDWPPGILTWPDFRAGSWGDVVALPLVVTGLAWLGPRARGVAPSTGAGVVGGLVGGAAGATVQWSWWADPDDPVTWTLTRPHHFSVPGAWHGVFFVVVSLVLGTLLAELVVWQRQPVVRARSSLRLSDDRRGLLLLGGGSTAFTGMLALDNAAMAHSLSTWSSSVALGGCTLALLAGVFIAWGRDALPRLPAFLGGVLWGAGMALASTTWPPGPLGWCVLVLGPVLLIATTRVPVFGPGAHDKPASR